MRHPTGTVQLPINEPMTPNSQIQEFLDHNRGPGVQHIALRTSDAIATVAQLRQRQVDFLDVPDTYYDAVLHRDGATLRPTQVRAIAQQQLLVDWQPSDAQALLLQTFTQPIFKEPTLFFEIIERQTSRGCVPTLTAAPPSPRTAQPLLVQGFGERNFQALFEAIEQEQAQRGGLQSPC